MTVVIRTLLASALVFGILVFIHELGHYLAARRAGIKVEAFSIGFGPVIHRWFDKVGTEWRLSILPLGGYVKLHGFEDPASMTQEERDLLEEGRTFHSKPLLSRIMVVAMGPIFNFVLAIFLFSLLFFVSGMPEVQSNIAGIASHSAAERAGLRVGDQLRGINGKILSDVPEFQEYFIKHPNKHVSLQIRRRGRRHNIPVTIGSVGKGESLKGQLGVVFVVKREPVHNPFMDVIYGMRETWFVSKEILVGVWGMITGQRSAAEMGGTIRIIQMSGQVAAHGFSSIVNFMALLSVNLGIINLFPIPALDGGRLVFYFAEGIMRRPVSDRIQQFALRIGIAIILTIFIFSTMNDLNSVGLFHYIAGLFHGTAGK